MAPHHHWLTIWEASAQPSHSGSSLLAGLPFWFHLSPSCFWPLCLYARSFCTFHFFSKIFLSDLDHQDSNNAVPYHKGGAPALHSVTSPTSSFNLENAKCGNCMKSWGELQIAAIFNVRPLKWLLPLLLQVSLGGLCCFRVETERHWSCAFWRQIYDISLFDLNLLLLVWRWDRYHLFFFFLDDWRTNVQLYRLRNWTVW